MEWSGVVGWTVDSNFGRELRLASSTERIKFRRDLQNDIFEFFGSNLRQRLVAIYRLILMGGYIAKYGSSRNFQDPI